jgi:hypothetical protein
MAKAELKTQPNDISVEDFLNEISDGQKREDSREISALMEKITGEKPKMWGGSIVGFGLRHLKYESGRELDWMETGFSPRKQNLTLYIMDGFAKYDELLAGLGKHKTGKSCLYIKRLSDVDKTVLENLIKESIEKLRKK